MLPPDAIKAAALGTITIAENLRVGVDVGDEIFEYILTRCAECTNDQSRAHWMIWADIVAKETYDIADDVNHYGEWSKRLSKRASLAVDTGKEDDQ